MNSAKNYSFARKISHQSSQGQFRRPTPYKISDAQEEQETLDGLTSVHGENEQDRMVKRQSNILELPQTSFSQDRFGSNAIFEEMLIGPTWIVAAIPKQTNEPLPAMQSEISGVASGAALVAIGSIASIILKFIGAFLIQRGFGAGPYGLYSICMDLVLLITLTCSFGLESTMIRYVAIYNGKGQSNSVRGLAIFCTIIAATAGMLGAIFLLLTAPQLAQIRHEPAIVALLQLMAPMIPLLCLQTVWLGGVQGFKALKWRVLSERILPPIVLIFLTVCVLLFYAQILGVVFATLISTLVGTLSSLYFFFRLLSKNSKPGPERYELGVWFAFAAPNFLTAITEIMLGSVDTLLLAFFAVADVEIGQYSAALRMSAFVALPLLSLNAMFAPIIAELHSKGEQRKLEEMFKVVTHWSITFSLPIFLIMVLFSRSLLDLSGESFVAAWSLLIALSFGNMINAGTSCVGYMLLMTGHQKLSFINSITAFAINLILGIILTPHYGAMGVAVSTGVALATVNLMRLIQVRLLLKMQPYRWDTLKPLAAGAVSALLIGSLLYVLHSIHLISQLILVPLFLVIYVGLIILFKISPEDKIVVDALRKKLGKRKK